jgi:signal transduction histidine kinase/CHASE2 domain-containing sensor protein
MFGKRFRLGTVLVLPICWAVLTALLCIDAFVPSNRWVYDHALHVAYRWHWADVAQAAGVYQQRPVFVQVDEASLRQLGRWPWSRSIHAQLLDRLNANEATTGHTQQNPRLPQTPSVVAWDVVFSEPQLKGVTSIATDEDADLAQAIDRSPFPVLLATQVDVQHGISRLIAPKAPIGETAARMGHIIIDTDSDGTVRRYWPMDQSMGVSLPYLGVALAYPSTARNMADIKAQLGAAPTAALESPPVRLAAADTLSTAPQWLYPMPSDWVQPVSFVSLWAGRVSPAVWAQQPVLIAAYSKGLGDQYVSPLYKPATVLNGGELILGALHTERLIAAGLPRLAMMSTLWQSLGVLLLTTVMFVALRRSASVRVQLLWVAGSVLLIGVLSMGVLMVAGVWMNVVQLVFASLLVWVLWMSNKLQRLLQFVFSRLAMASQHPLIASPAGSTPRDDLNALYASMPQNAAQLPQPFQSLPAGRTDKPLKPVKLLKPLKPDLAGDAIEVQLAAMDVLEVRHQDEYARLSQVLELMPDATFVLSDLDGAGYRVSLQNLEARLLTQRFPALGTPSASNAAFAAWSLNACLQDFAAELTPAQHDALYKIKALPLATTLSGAASLAQPSFHWNELLALSDKAEFESGVLATTPAGERYLIKLAHLAALPTFRLASEARDKPVLAGELAAPASRGSAVLSIVDLSVSQALNENRERTLSFLSHDLRSPQSTILSLLAVEREHHPELNQLFDSIQFQAHRTLQLAEGFVQWSQASHRAAYQFMEYDLNELMIDALDELWASAKEKGIALNGDAIEHELWVLLDRTLLWRALVNLISNALNACPVGSEIRLSTGQVDGWAQLVVQDNGPGIALAAQARLFEPFVQGSGLKRTGAGLGLAFVKTVMDQHRGQVQVISPVPAALRGGAAWPSKAQGTRFELLLPLQAAPLLPDDDKSSADKHSADKSSPDKRRID